MRRLIWMPLYLFFLLLMAAGFVPAIAQMMGGPFNGPGGGSHGGHDGEAYGVPAGSANHGRQIVAAKCAACHGADGNSTDPQFPKLAGQNPSYLYDQILAFKTKKRPSAVMTPMVAALSDSDAAAIARFYSEQVIRPDRIKDLNLRQKGEQIFVGHAGLDVPACAMCHGRGGASLQMTRMMHMMGRGMMAPIPNLYGQHASYIVKQLNDFATGRRQGAMMNGAMMNRIAPALSEPDRKAVAAYLSSLH